MSKYALVARGRFVCTDHFLRMIHRHADALQGRDCEFLLGGRMIARYRITTLSEIHLCSIIFLALLALAGIALRISIPIVDHFVLLHFFFIVFFFLE